MITELAANAIKYDWYLTGPQGARFTLYPLTGFHTKKDVKEAKAQLLREQDVVKFYIEWKDKEEWHQLPLFLHHFKEENEKLNKQFKQTVDKMVGLYPSERDSSSKTSTGRP